MKKAIAYLVLSIVISSSVVSAQQRAFGVNERSYYTKVIRLGSAYTGYAEGIESINTNTAGLANTNLVNLLYSDAYGGLLLGNKKPSYSLSFTTPTQLCGIIVGASYNRLSLDVGADAEWINTKYALHAAKKLSANFSAGLSLNYFRLDSKMNISTAENPFSYFKEEMDSYAFDLSIGLLYKVEDPFYWNFPNKLGFGLYLENVLAAKESLDIPEYLEDQAKPDHKFQQIRLGTSYEVASTELKYHNLDFLKMLFVFDAVFNSSNYEFLTWQPNYGIEFTLLEVLSFSFGRENEIKIDEDVYGTTYAYPVTRYGIGINLPFKKMFDLDKTVRVEINYSYSDWQKLNYNLIKYYPLDNQSLSILLAWSI